MAFTGNFMASTFKQELLKGVHNFTTSTGNTFKIALYTSSASFTAATTAYTATNEIATGGGYTQPGLALTIPASMPSLTTTVAWTDFDDALWSSSTITNAAGAMIYNDTASGDPAVAILDFGGNKSSSAGDFTVTFPTPPTSANAIIRIA